MIQSTTPASSTYSHSNSSQHDPSSPPHPASMPPSDASNNTTYHSNSAPQSANRGSIEALDSSINGYRTSTAFNPAFSTNPGAFSSPSAPSHGSFNVLGPSPNSQQQQQQQRPYRTDLPASASFPSHFPGPQATYPTRADIFGTSQSLDALGRYEYDSFPGDPAANSAQHHAHTQPHLGAKQQSYNMNGGFGTPGTSTGSALLQSQQVQVSKMPQQNQGQNQAPQQPQLQSQLQQGYASNGPPTINGGGPYLNGVAHGHAPPPHHATMQPAVNGAAFGGPAHGHGAGQHAMHHAPGPGPGPGPAPGPAQSVGLQLQQGPPQQGHQPQQAPRGEQAQEEISTIFVVGFPEDMHEREFQNMFTFSVGFEAATLKIPNKDSSAYGPAAGASGAASTLRQAGFLPSSSSYPNPAHQQAGTAPYSGAQDPYNLVTVNSGGVVVDGPQGTSSSWQQSNASNDQFNSGDPAHGQAPTMPPRKQIIGFAKFRSRQEALDARDVLQGRRVDIEKGAVLKAEMAKKNLHTKRGVGPLGLPLGLMGVGGGVVGPEMLAGVPGLNGFAAATTAAPAPVTQAQAADALTQRDKELGVLGAMGLGGMARPRDEEKDRRDMAQQQQRPRDDEERRRKEKELERERNSKLRMNNATVYDAFHSVPIGSRAGSTATPGVSPQSTLTPGPGYADPGSAFPGYGFQSNGNGNGFQSNGANGSGNFGQSQFQNQSFASQDGFGQSNANSSTWGLPSKPADVVNNATQKTPGLPSSLPPRPPSSLQSSPPANYDAPFLPSANSGRTFYGSDSSAFSPPEFSVQLPPIGPRPRAQSPVFDGQPPYGSSSAQQGGSSHPQSSSSSVAGSQSSLEGEFSRTLTVSTHQGMTSPQLPSPGSGGSSNNARQGNASDQNPPINTLYVGNLPNSPVPTGYPPNYLEESLRALFSRCPGYRKLCFRQKSNGPMCFVEFEDVSYATKALNDLYGNQLNGFVKGGIRLSFSKNPLGVRPTPSTANSHNSQHSGRRDAAREWNGHAQQQQQHSGMSYSSIHDAFQSRAPQPPPQHQQQGLSLDIGTSRQMRHEASEMSSPNPMYNYSISPPPSRFFSPPPSSSQSSFGAIAPSTSSFPRSTAPGGYNQPPGFGSSQHSPPYLADGDERLRFRDPPPHAFASSPGLETTTRVG